jgi:ribosomal peptide maturation radical SAM protein 1
MTNGKTESRQKGPPLGRVLLVTMPFAGIDRPALGISLLQSALMRDGILADIAYFNLSFAEMLGPDFYSLVSNHVEPDNSDVIPYTALAGDWMFSQWYYGPGSLDAQEYVDVILRDRFALKDNVVTQILNARAAVPRFLHRCLDSVRWEDYSLVGFTSTFEQTFASLSLARLIKERHPEIRIILGGANCEGVMGEELHRQFPFVDYVANGEADHSFPSLVRALREGREPSDIKGIIWRRNGRSISNGAAGIVRDLDQLAYPNFDDYFKQLSASSVSKTLQPWLQIEAARGCWWGERSHCTFCGLNGATMAFRSKSPRRVLDELFYVHERHDISYVAFVDNILDLQYFKTVLPELAQRKHDMHIFYETKSNLKREQVQLLRQAGIETVQPGIESLSSPILKLMGKGVSALQNIAVMKWARQHEVFAAWNLLYGFPKEDPAEYSKILDILQAITHLPPPDGVGPIRLDRFSPNFNEARKHGFSNLRPLQPYRYIYPFDDEALSNLCYFFDFDYSDGRNPADYVDSIVGFCADWKQQPKGTLTHTRLGKTGARIEDTRFNRIAKRVNLDRVQNAAYEFCDVPRHVSLIKALLERSFPRRIFEIEKIVRFLEYLVEVRVMVREGDVYLSVAPTQASDTLQSLANDRDDYPLENAVAQVA